MGEPASKQTSPLTLEGLDSVFDQTSEVITPCSEDSEITSEDFRTDEDSSSEVFGTSREILTTTEAATRLGISPRAVINRLKAGTLAGERTQGRFKEEWRVYWNELPNTSEVIDYQPDVADQKSEPSSEQSESGSEEPQKTSEVHGPNLLSDLLLAHTEQVKSQTELIRYLSEQLKDKDAQIKALTTERDTQTKLLADNEKNLQTNQNSGWWARFSSWLFR